MKNKKSQINIPKPCSYGWDKMTLIDDSKGRHCNACDKIVVDFTKMSTAQIISLLDKNKGIKTCGHFKTIDTTVAKWYHRPFLKLYSNVENNYRKNSIQIAGLFLIGSILLFTGCKEQHTDGEISIPEDTLIQVDTSFYVDTVSTSNAEVNSNSDNIDDSGGHQ